MVATLRALEDDHYVITRYISTCSQLRIKFLHIKISFIFPINSNIINFTIKFLDLIKKYTFFDQVLKFQI